jgi:hypothetical protein
MKHKTLLLTLAAALALGLAGCGKNETGTTAADNANMAADTTAVAATTAVAEATNAAATMNAADNSQVQELIDKAKSFIAETNFSDASSTLQQLAGQSLTDEQQKIVDGLKDQIQKALAAKAAGDAAGAAGGLLK